MLSSPRCTTRELTQLRVDVPALVRVVNQLTVENQQLRAQLTEMPTGVIAIGRQSQ
jgi:regulator of replication initiation timing